MRVSTIDQQVIKGLLMGLTYKQGVTFEVRQDSFPLYMQAIRKEILSTRFEKPEVTVDFKTRIISIALNYKGVKINVY